MNNKLKTLIKTTGKLLKLYNLPLLYQHICSRYLYSDMQTNRIDVQIDLSMI